MVLDSRVPGPRALVVGGQHGDEPSGALAARALARGPRPRKGVLVVIPAANPEALAARRRGTPDLNRTYPAASPAAAAIYTEASKADLVLDLHESGPAWQEADAPTLVVSPAAAPLALEILERVNVRTPRFTFTGGAPAGSLVGELGAEGRRAVGVEVPARLPLAQRLALHRRVLEAALEILGLR